MSALTVQLPRPDGGRIVVSGETPEELQANVQDIVAGWDARRARVLLIDAIRDLIASVKATSWDFIDAYAPFPVEGSQGTPDGWPQMPGTPLGSSPTVGQAVVWLLGREAVTTDRIQVLRVEATRTAIHKIKLANVLGVLITVLARVVIADDAVEPPPVR